MERYGISADTGCIPMLDPDFFPIARWNAAFLRTAKQSLCIAVSDPDGQALCVHTCIHGTDSMRNADRYYLSRLVKTMLWIKGGCRVFCNHRSAADMLQEIFGHSFDADFMSRIYRQPFSVTYTDTVPESYHTPQQIGGHWDGCRIGLDVGGSDCKVSAVMDGQAIWSAENVWHPKEHADPAYHYAGIVSCLKEAARHLPHVDAVGISSAGVCIDNRIMRAGLFEKIPSAIFERQIPDLYCRAVRDIFGSVPCRVINDGDVSALAGAISLHSSGVLGIAMGTSQAGGFVDQSGCITGWLNELAFVPVNVSANAPKDPWSGDIGCGATCFSQDAVIRLAEKNRIFLPEQLSPAEKLKMVQSLVDSGDSRAQAVYQTIGTYLGHTLAYYHQWYDSRYVLLLGRVMSGTGGSIILQQCRQVLQTDYPALYDTIQPVLPDENFRRVGQSIVAASLPERL